jgi:hypothetical protein
MYACIWVGVLLEMSVTLGVGWVIFAKALVVNMESQETIEKDRRRTSIES